MIKLLHKIFLFFINVYLFPLFINAQQDNLIFDHLTIEDGLSQSVINCIVQDHMGFMWFGTEAGLNKYDGYNFTVYKHNPNDLNSISPRTIWSIYEDKSGVLWIGTSGDGLNKFDREKEVFIHYRHNTDSLNSLSNNSVSSIYEDKSGVFWIGTHGGGLNKFDREKEIFTHYKHNSKNSFSISHDKIVTIYEDKSGILWIGTDGYGLNRYDRNNERFYHYVHDSNNPFSLSHNDIVSIYEDKYQVLWIGTYGGGLNRFDRKNEKFSHYKHDSDNLNSLSNNQVFSILEDHYGSLWVGTHGGGLNKFDRKREQFIHYKHNMNNPHSITSNYIYQIYKDNSGILWIGTDGGGLNKLDRVKENFTHYKLDSDNPFSLSQNDIVSLYVDKSCVLWIGTYSEGLIKFDREKKQSIYYKHDSDNPYSLSHNFVWSIYEDKMDVLWIGTYNGLNKFDRKKEQFIHYKHDLGNQNSLSHNSISTIYEDNSGVLWIGTYSGGLNRFDSNKGHFIRYKQKDAIPFSLSNNYVKSIFEDKSGILWVGTRDGLNKFDREKEEFTRYKHDSENPYSLSHNSISSIYEDKLGCFWIGTVGGGLNKLDREKKQFIHYREKDGLLNNIVYGILEDSKNNLWLKTNNGLSIFNPKTELFRNYNTKYGLQRNEFSGSVFYRSKNGQIFFGGINGFNFFNPDSINYNRHIPPVSITDFKIFNESVTIREKNGVVNRSGYYLPKHISLTEKIELTFRESVFSFEFAALDYHRPKKNMYAYSMKGFDSDWVFTGAQYRNATYTNLDPGEYIFKVKGSNNDGIWNEEGASIKIIITPPWWQTWWFRVLAGFSIVSLLGLGYNYRVSNLRKIASAQKEFSRKLIDSQEKDRKRIASELHDSHGQNLLIISNELQQYTIEHKDAEEKMKSLTETVNESINEIREISYDLHPHPIDKLGIKDAVETMISRIENSTSIKFTSQLDNIEGLFSKKVEINLYRIIQEAINNIIKHSMATKAKIEIKKNIKYVIITISDNGKGFDKKKMLKESNGLGLNGMEERAKLMGGSFRIKSIVGKGTEIVIKTTVIGKPNN